MLKVKQLFLKNLNSITSDLGGLIGTLVELEFARFMDEIGIEAIQQPKDSVVDFVINNKKIQVKKITLYNQNTNLVTVHLRRGESLSKEQCGRAYEKGSFDYLALGNTCLPMKQDWFVIPSRVLRSHGRAESFYSTTQSFKIDHLEEYSLKKFLQSIR